MLSYSEKNYKYFCFYLFPEGAFFLRMGGVVIYCRGETVHLIPFLYTKHFSISFLWLQKPFHQKYDNWFDIILHPLFFIEIIALSRHWLVEAPNYLRSDWSIYLNCARFFICLFLSKTKRFFFVPHIKCYVLKKFWKVVINWNLFASCVYLPWKEA